MTTNLIYPTLLLVLFFLPSLVAISTQHPRYLIVAIYNVLIGWTGLGWLFLLYKVWPRSVVAVAGRRAV